MSQIQKQQQQNLEPEVFLKMKRNGMWAKIEKEIQKHDYEIRLTLKENPNASWRRKWLTKKLLEGNRVTLRYEAIVSNLLLEKYGRFGLK